MRVVAGAYRGRRLTAPIGRRTRPTADRVREAVFAMLGSIDGLRVLDLFAGSGALGIEAASRGAAAVTFVEIDRGALRAIRSNLSALGLERGGVDGPRMEVVRRDALAYLEGAPERFDVIFLDPPYSSARRMAGPLAERLPAVTSKNGRIVTESDKRHPLELTLPLLRERSYGDTRIAIHGGS